MSLVTATFSIVGRSDDGKLGVAVSSCVPAVGAACPFVRPGLVAISCQAYTHPYLALDLIRRLEQGGASVADAGRDSVAADTGSEWRQMIAIGPFGDPFTHTGEETDAWAGQRAGRDCAAAGNLLVGEGVVDGMIEAFESSPANDLPDRLLAALGAAQAAGGDRRGRQSAAILVHASEAVAYVNLRVDDHADPVAELSRLWSLYTPDDRKRALRTATTREPRPLDELRARQAQVREALAEQGR
jgi:uncharacterized Ntn-hydrolase superfamily protein